MSAKKIVLLGRAGTGKTSIKKVLFEGAMPLDLISSPLSPTKGISSSVYQWLDLELGVFDTSGQELTQLLGDLNEQEQAFSNSEAVIYVLENTQWKTHSDVLIKEIKEIQGIMDNFCKDAKLILFFHKIDLLDKKNQEISQLKKNESKVRKKLKLNIDYSIYYTSIHPDLIYHSYKAFFDVFSSFSQVTIDLTTVLENILKSLSKTLIILTDQNNSILVQNMTRDFNSELVGDLYKKISKKFLVSEDMTSIAVISQYNKNTGFLIKNIVKDNTEILFPVIKNIISASETIDEKQYPKLMKSIRNSLNKYYKKNKKNLEPSV